MLKPLKKKIKSEIFKDRIKFIGAKLASQITNPDPQPQIKIRNL